MRDAVIALAALLSPVAVCAQPVTSAEFNAGGIDFTMPLPKGFCLRDTPQAKAVTQMVAASDANNLTLLMIFDCAGEPGDTDNFVIKIPARFLMVEVTREQLIREVSAAFETPEIRAEITSERLNAITSSSISDVLNTEVQIDSAFAPSGHDDVCVYMDGIITMTVAEKEIKVAAAGCMTAVGGRMLSIYRYGEGNIPGRSKKLIPEVRAMAESIRVRAAR